MGEVRDAIEKIRSRLNSLEIKAKEHEALLDELQQCKKILQSLYEFNLEKNNECRGGHSDNAK